MSDDRRTSREERLAPPFGDPGWLEFPQNLIRISWARGSGYQLHLLQILRRGFFVEYAFKLRHIALEAWGRCCSRAMCVDCINTQVEYFDAIPVRNGRYLARIDQNEDIVNGTLKTVCKGTLR